MTIKEKKKKILASLKKCLTQADTYGTIELEKDKTFKTGNYEITLEKGYVIPNADDDFVARFCKLMNIVDQAYKAKIIDKKDFNKLAEEISREYH